MSLASIVRVLAARADGETTAVLGSPSAKDTYRIGRFRHPPKQQLDTIALDVTRGVHYVVRWLAEWLRWADSLEHCQAIIGSARDLNEP